MRYVLAPGYFHGSASAGQSLQSVCFWNELKRIYDKQPIYYLSFRFKLIYIRASGLLTRKLRQYLGCLQRRYICKCFVFFFIHTMMSSPAAIFFLCIGFGNCKIKPSVNEHVTDIQTIIVSSQRAVPPGVSHWNAWNASRRSTRRRKRVNREAKVTRYPLDSRGFTSVTSPARPETVKAIDSRAEAGFLKLPLLRVCVNHYLRCSQHNGTSGEYGLCDAGERRCQNTELKEGQSREGDGGRGGRKERGEGREEGSRSRRPADRWSWQCERNAVRPVFKST